MKRKDFFKNGLSLLGGFVGLTAISSAYKNSEESGEGECQVSPRETAGPFSTKSPAEWVRANIVSNKKGIALMISIKVQDTTCTPLHGAIVDIWHCDSNGYYSEYGAHRMQRKDFRGEHFLRGRQRTDQKGNVSFISIYPGWYPGRAPHIHVEVFDTKERSLLITQIAFPDEISEKVYKDPNYIGAADTSNNSDMLFANSLEGNLASLAGNVKDGFTLNHTITVRT